jgi:DNA-binding MarR family transcriptional regulator/N-acetylglutamate synthase-like GNAT family acetyltransferase
MGLLEREISSVRRFNRFYTQRIGALQRPFLDSPFSLTEARVLYELTHRKRPTAAELGASLGLDAGYLSRMLASFERQGLIARTQSANDGRRRPIELTGAGRRAFLPLEARSQAVVGAMLRPLGGAERRELAAALARIETLLGEHAGKDKPDITIRSHRAGDIGWIIAAHARVYGEEYGWDASFEGFVADILAKFAKHHDAQRERCWIAELDGEPVGSLALMRQSAAVAKLRVFVVTREARGHGIGRALVAESLHFARAAHYRKVVLWTQKGLNAARHLYEEAGFTLAREEPHHSWGKDHIGQYWELKL